MNKKKKLIFVTWSLSLGGGEARSTTEILNNINLDKYDVDVWEFNHGNKVLDVRKEIHFLPSIVNCQEDNIQNQRRVLNHYSHHPELVTNLFNNEYDCAIACGKGLTSYIVAHIPALKRIVWVRGASHDVDVNLAACDSEKSKIGREYQRQSEAFDKFDKIIAISDSMFISLSNLFPKHKSKIKKIYNNIDVAKVRRKATEQIDIYQPSHNNVLVNVGRLREVKNQKLLIDMMKILTSRKEDIELIIIGDGLLEDELRKYVKEQKLENHVKLVGYYANPFPLIKKSKIFCLSSLSEGFCLSISEACALGLPFVSTKVGGAEELLNRGECGILANYDPDDFANKVEVLLEDNELYNRYKQNCEMVSNKFDIKELTAEVEELIEE